MQPKLSKFFESYATNLHGAPAETSSSDSGSEAWFSVVSSIDPSYIFFLWQMASNIFPLFLKKADDFGVKEGGFLLEPCICKYCNKLQVPT